MENWVAMNDNFFRERGKKIEPGFWKIVMMMNAVPTPPAKYPDAKSGWSIHPNPGC